MSQTRSRSNRPSFRERAEAVKAQITCGDVFDRYGVDWSHQTFRSPLREDANPSFSIFANGERWKDFATGEGGDILDLIQRLEERSGRSCSTKDALEIVEGFAGIHPTSWTSPVVPVKRHSTKRKAQPTNDLSGFAVPESSGERFIHSSGDLSGPFDLALAKTAFCKRWIRRCKDGVWRTGLQGKRAFLFVPERERPRPGDVCFITEGHSDCLAIHGEVVEGRRVFAVSLPHSSARFDQEWTDFFSSSPEWSVVSDSGEAGAKHATRCADQLVAAGIRARIINLPGFDGRCNEAKHQGEPSRNEDLRNWLQDYGHSVGELVEFAESIPAVEPLPGIDETLVLESLAASAQSWIEAARSGSCEDADGYLVRSCLQWLFTAGTRRESLQDWLTKAGGFQRAEQIAQACLAYARANDWTANGQRREKRIYGGPSDPDAAFDPLEFTQAQEDILQNEDRLFEELSRHYEASKEWQAAETWIEETFLDPDVCRREKRREKLAIQRRFGVDLNKATRELWRYTAGLGKSEAALRLVLRLCERFPDFKVLYLVPNLGLAEELEERAQAVGVPRSMVFRGKTQPGVCLVEQAVGAVSLLNEAGFSAAELCSRTDPVTGAASICKHFEACPYQRAVQRARSLGGLVIAAHNYATVQSQLSGVQFGLVVMDESFDKWHRSHAILREDLENVRIWKPSARERLGGIGARLWSWIEGGCDLEEMRRNGWNSKTFRELSGDLSDLEIRPYLKPNMDPEDLVREVRQAMKYKLEDASYQARRVVGKMLHCLAVETKHEKPVQAVHFVPARGERSARIRVEELRRPSIPKERPCLILDATASELIARRLYGEELTFLRIQARRNLILHQVVSSTFSKSYLGIGNKDQEPDRPSRGFERTVEALNVIGPEAVIAPKDFEARIEPELNRRGAVSGHYGDFIGSNRFSNCVTGAIVGRNEPAAVAVENQARALNLGQPEPLVLRGEYSRLFRKYELKQPQARRVGVLANCHDDSTCQAVLEGIREAQLEQAADRFRCVHPGKTAEVWLFCNVPVPGLQVDDLVELDAITGGFGSEARLACAWNQTGFLPLKADGMILSGMAPSVFKTASEAAETLKRSKCRNKNNNQIWSGSNKNYIELDHIWKFPDLKDLLQNLEEAAGNLGPVGVFEFKTAAGAKKWSRLLVQLDRVSTSPETIEGVFRAFLVNLGFELAAFRTVSLPMVGTLDTTAAFIQKVESTRTQADYASTETLATEKGVPSPDQSADLADKTVAALNLAAAMIQSGMDRETASRIAFEGVGLAWIRPNHETPKKAVSELPGTCYKRRPSSYWSDLAVIAQEKERARLSEIRSGTLW